MSRRKTSKWHEKAILWFAQNFLLPCYMLSLPLKYVYPQFGWFRLLLLFQFPVFRCQYNFTIVLTALFLRYFCNRNTCCFVLRAVFQIHQFTSKIRRRYLCTDNVCTGKYFFSISKLICKLTTVRLPGNRTTSENNPRFTTRSHHNNAEKKRKNQLAKKRSSCYFDFLFFSQNSCYLWW